MNILLKSLTIVNFKGIKSFKIDFSDVTNVFGSNATGKTTLFDAFLFLFFGKDSSDRKDFNIKPLNAFGQSSDKVEVDVSATLDASGVQMNLRRVFREKWTKKRGSETAEFEGNETLYFWNDVPLQQKEYMSKIETIINEGVFKLITNPLYFNALKWQDRRQVLLGIAGSIDDSDVFDSITTMSNKSEVFNLTNILNQGKTLSEYKKEISAKKKKANDELKLIPSRIDEAQRSKPEMVDFDKTRLSIQGLKSELEKVEEIIADASKQNETRLKEVQAKQNNLYSLKSSLSEIEFRIREEIKDRLRKSNEEPLRINREMQSLNDAIGQRILRRDNLIKQNADSTSLLQPMRDQIAEENEKQLVFTDGDFTCPTCKRIHEEEDIEAQKEQMLKNFNSAKVTKIDNIKAKGISIKKQIENNEAEISELDAEIKEKEDQVSSLKSKLDLIQSTQGNPLDEKEELTSLLGKDNEYLELQMKINALQAEINEAKQEQSAPKDSTLINKKEELNQSIANLNRILASEDQIKRTDVRIEELKDQERQLAQLIAEYDGSEFIIEAFTKAKMNIMESRINSKFTLAKFKMFDTQINGSEVETCDTTYNGVTWSDLNTAAKIQVGIDIINALSDYYNVNAPIWIDNRESTVNIPDTDSQVINLIVSEYDSVLRVENKKPELIHA